MLMWVWDRWCAYFQNSSLLSRVACKKDNKTYMNVNTLISFLILNWYPAGLNSTVHINKALNIKKFKVLVTAKTLQFQSKIG